jgi:general secretion pathway protein A
MDLVFTELKPLNNFELDSKNCISIILTGQPELLFRIQMSHFRLLCQRIRLSVSLQMLTCEETARYIEHQIRLSGNQTEIFSERAKADVLNLSEGLPSKINTICHSFLLKGAIEKKAVID